METATDYSTRPQTTKTQRRRSPLSRLGRPIPYYRAFLDFTGSLGAALFLSQAVEWSQRAKNKQGWFCKSADQWTRKTGLSRRAQEAARRILRAYDWWHEDLRKADGAPTLHFRIDMDALLTFCENELGLNGKFGSDGDPENPE